MASRMSHLARPLFVLLFALSLLPGIPLLPTPTASAATAQVSFPLGARRPFGTNNDYSQSVALGDLNGDGHLDIAVGTWGRPNRIFWNDGHGHFENAPTMFNTMQRADTRSLALGDLDEDGDLDIVIATYNGQSKLYLNDIQHNFSEAQARLIGPADATIQSVALGDLNGDGRLDIVVGSTTQTTIYLNDAQHLFSATIPVGAVGRDEQRSLALGDLNGDGRLDIVVGMSGGQSWVYLNDAQQSFTQSIAFGPASDTTQSVALGDLDGDGRLDIVVGRNGRSQIYFNLAQNPFAEANSSFFGPNRQDTRAVDVSDLDGDGRLDIATANYLGQSWVYLNTPLQPFQTAVAVGSEAAETIALAAGDLDGDGALDLVNMELGQRYVYLNSGAGTFAVDQTTTFGTGSEQVQSLALGDMNGDGRLDIVAGLEAGQSRIYFNAAQTPFATSLPFGPDSGGAIDVAVGDMNGDGRLDLVFIGTGNRAVYLNTIEYPFTTSINFGENNDRDNSVAVGDIDGDGRLDILVGSEAGGRVYLNAAQQPFSSFIPFGQAATSVISLAVGDVDRDGDLDLAGSGILRTAAGGQPQIMLFHNNGSEGFSVAQVISTADTIYSVALGDLDGQDGLDLAVGGNGQNRIFFNNGQGGLLSEPQPFGLAEGLTRSLAVADLDGDGDLDLVTGNYGRQSVVDLNRDGWFDTASTRTFGTRLDYTYAVTAGDLDGDGRPEVVAGNFGQWSRVYAAGPARSSPAMPPVPAPHRPGSTPDAPLLSTPLILASQVISLPFALSDPEGKPAATLSAEYSLDGGGEWHTAVPTQTRITSLATMPERFPTYPATPINIPDPGTISSSVNVAAPANGIPGRISDVEIELTIEHPFVGDLTARLTAPDGTTVDLFTRVGADGDNLTGLILDDEAATSISSGTAPFSGRFQPMGSLANFDGKSPLGQWTLTITDAATVDTGRLVAWALRLKTTGVQHTFAWDTSQVFGQSDNVVVRLRTTPPLSSGPNQAPRFQHPYAAATTVPFRVRGNQVRVINAQQQPMAGAVVFRLNEGLERDQQLFAADPQAPGYTTNAAGYLAGRGILTPGDELVALAPILPLPGPYAGVYSSTVRLYATNIMTRPDGLSGMPVTQAGVQTVTVSLERPLVLFDLLVSVEWDARYDTRFTAQLEADLARSSELLFQASHGQAALGHVLIFYDRENWDYADIRIYASNRVRPSALIGGIAFELLNDPDTEQMLYGPGQVHMGATWNRFGNAGSNLGEDWPRTFVHELGHYLFFLEDNYLGFSDDLVVPVSSCPGLMSDPYAAVWQFQTRAGWSPGCDNTFSNQATQRADWETLTTFYPNLHAPTGSLANLPQGPIRQPLALTEITAVPPLTPTERLDVPIFYTVDLSTSARIIPALTARAFLFQHSYGEPSEQYDRIVPLGRAINDQVLARGARVGDRLCLFEPTAARFGCERIREGDERLELRTRPAWQPQIRLTPITSRTLELQVAQVPSGVSELRATLYPLDDDLPPPPISLTVEAPGVYSGHFQLSYPLPGAYIHLATNDGPDPTWEAVISYALDGNAGAFNRVGGGGAFNRVGGGGAFNRVGGGGAFNRVGGGGAFNRVGGGGAPVASSEGDILLVGENLNFGLGQFLLLQTSSSLPPIPGWATLIGQGYHFTTSPNWLTATEALSQTALSFSYLDSEVPTGEEDGIQVYYHAEQATAWRAVPTAINSYFNLAAIANQGPGLYALMSSIRIPLPAAGWNNFAYSAPLSRTVGSALESISGRYRIVYSHVPTATEAVWQVYAPAPAPAWVSDLRQLEFGRGYWIYTTQADDLLLRGGTTTFAATPSAPADQLSLPPATLYAVLNNHSAPAPTAGQAVEAWIGTALCGRSLTHDVGDGQVGFVLKVAAIGPATPGCGAPGSTVTVLVADQAYGHAVWDNTQAVDLNAVEDASIYLPFVRR